MKSFKEKLQKRSRPAMTDHMAHQDRDANSLHPPDQRLQASPVQQKSISKNSEPIQAWFGKKKKKGNAAPPSINSMEQLGGTASDVYRAKLSGGIGEYNSDTAYVKKALRGVTDKDMSPEELQAVNAVANNASGQMGIYGSNQDHLKHVLEVYKRTQGEGKNVIGGATTANVNIPGLNMSDVVNALGKSPEEQKEMGLNAMQAPELLLQDPRLLARSVASSRLDQALGINVLSHEMFGKYQDETVGLSAEITGGKALSEHVDLNKGTGNPEKKISVKSDADWKGAKTQKGMSDLTLMDALTGQQDRHGGNIMLDPSGNVKGIDNDMAFGTNNLIGLKNIKSALFTENLDKKGNVKSLNYRQELIDEQTGNAILKMTESKFKKTLKGDKNDPQSLSDAEISAALMRFKAIKKQVKKLKKQKKLVKNWDDDTFNAMMSEGKDTPKEPGGMVDNKDAVNYLARSLSEFQGADDQLGDSSTHVKESGYKAHLEEKRVHEDSQARVMNRRMRHFEDNFANGGPRARQKPFKLSNVMSRRMAHFDKKYKEGKGF